MPWLIDLVSRVLEPAERAIVLGDLTEARETGALALRDVLGLAARRQLGLWHHWRPWLVFVGLMIPLTFLLSLVSSREAGMNAVYSWMYFNNSDWEMLQHRMFWITLRETIVLISPSILALICMSWTIGFMLAALSRRTIPIVGALFCLLLLFGELVEVPQYSLLQTQALAASAGRGPFATHAHDTNAVTSLAFYRLVFPLLVQIALVLLPSLWGMYKGAGRAMLKTIVWAPALGGMAFFGAMQAVWWIALASHNSFGIRLGWPMPMRMPPVLFALAGPVVYLATAGWERWHVAKPRAR
jgi:hypothetical protein